MICRWRRTHALRAAQPVNSIPPQLPPSARAGRTGIPSRDAKAAGSARAAFSSVEIAASRPSSGLRAVTPSGAQGVDRSPTDAIAAASATPGMPPLFSSDPERTAWIAGQPRCAAGEKKCLVGASGADRSDGLSVAQRAETVTSFPDVASEGGADANVEVSA